eukprot:CAMPEP_0118718300 /NCGR_PEP_ID=MMETSP0800-20121206/28720_1 /TAXON_ID=210618 ORGANISM="Striatella unipunctata, Strain CCMP2910" /NCGR_SAMPLE_ID=MMETSP0800 /ASSEMBLY_ACC=CAM_ASM_000638 /LENGTH=54 /DNA_ID=CAMNT_0006625297 /DNA_START=28 /DNA_END=188 /DNA_ORIENTATION=+
MDTDSFESDPSADLDALTVGGSWQGSPSITIERQLLLAVIGMSDAGSTLWHASS